MIATIRSKVGVSVRRSATELAQGKLPMSGINSKKVISIGFALVILGGFAFMLSKSLRKAPESVAKAPNKVLAPEFVETHDRKVKEDYQKVRYTQEKQNLPFSDRFKNTVLYLNSLNNYFNKDAVIAELIAEMLKDPRTVETAAQTLSNHDQAQTWCGDEQAICRVFSIKILKQVAQTGNLEPIESTVQNLKDVLDNPQHVEVKGQDRDLEDLISAYVSVHDPEEILNDIPQFYAKLGLTDLVNTSGKVREIFDDAVFLSLQRKVDRKKLRNNLAQFFDGK